MYFYVLINCAGLLFLLIISETTPAYKAGNAYADKGALLSLSSSDYLARQSSKQAESIIGRETNTSIYLSIDIRCISTYYSDDSTARCGKDRSVKTSPSDVLLKLNR